MNPMIDQPSAYFRQWISPRSDLLQSLEAEARAEKIPIVGPVVGHLLYLLARMCGARRILELGTATGYSTIFLGRACRRTGGHVITVESDAGMARRARQNFISAGLDGLIEVRCQNALETLRSLKGAMDMVFMDIEKSDYAAALPLCARLLDPGGLLVADNTGFKDAHAFNTAIHMNPAWEMVNIWGFLPGHSPEHDGLCIALRA
jgi:caffeoyl-CoA O-methyltransferase